ncbi:hypothetical protein D0Z07_1651 [Hyphodiscus hymeniophilus]|uniref:Uncharacterized protein n=1 Tax=Hyphodiscus hymeniophilus TaxID=353542 RepID=A0A9P6VNR5_9HELO|nr:hypothetical protein D0Z07_1651 [Hyphodiscus hymeniophilus]
MGSGSSKPTSPPQSQVWTSESPVRFSQELIDSLQSSTENDSTRAKTLELHIQSRVNSELKKLQERASKDFEELSARISAAESSAVDKGKSAGDALRDLGRESVQNDVQELRKKLEQRKKLTAVDEGVEKAKTLSSSPPPAARMRTHPLDAILDVRFEAISYLRKSLSIIPSLSNTLITVDHLIFAPTEPFCLAGDDPNTGARWEVPAE